MNRILAVLSIKEKSDRRLSIHRNKSGNRPPLMTSAGFTPKKAGFQRQRSAYFSSSTEGNAVGNGRIDRVSSNIATSIHLGKGDRQNNKENSQQV